MTSHEIDDNFMHQKVPIDFITIILSFLSLLSFFFVILIDVMNIIFN